MMKSFLLFFFVFFVSQFTNAQTCTAPDNIYQNVSNDVTGTSDQGQSFTATCNGDIISLRVWTNGVAQNINGTLKIYEGTFDGFYNGADLNLPILHEQSFNWGTSSSEVEQTIQLSALVPVTSGQIYTFMLLNTNGRTTYSYYDALPTNIYTGGDQKERSGTFWYNDSDDDLKFQIHYTDVIDPIANCKNATIYLDANGEANLSHTQINNGSSGGVASYQLSQETFNCNDLGTNTVTLNVYDISNNGDACQATVTVIDNVSPINVSCPADIIVNSDSGLCTAIVNYAIPTFSDNCTIDSTSRINGLASGSVFPLGDTIVTYRATDNSGNTTDCSFTVTVNDSVSPVFTSCPTDIAQCTAIVNYNLPTATDNCNVASVTLTNGLASGSSFPAGDTVVTYTAIDDTGNSTDCSFTVTVNGISPSFTTCPSNINQANDIGLCGATVTYATPTAGACYTVSLTSGLASGSFFPIGTTNITYEAEGVDGSIATCNFSVIVTDDENPIAICQDVNLTLDENGLGTVSISAIDNGSVDNCTTLTRSMSVKSFSGTTTNSDQTDDLLGNGSVYYIHSYSFVAPSTNQYEFKFTGNSGDSHGSIMSLWNDVPVRNSGNFTSRPEYVGYTGRNNDGSLKSGTQLFNLTAGITYYFDITTNTPSQTVTAYNGNAIINDSEINFDCNPGTYPIELIVEDTSGNIASCVSNIVVIDTTAPVFIDCSNIIVDINSNGSVVNFNTPTVADCSQGIIPIQTAGLTSGSTFPLGTSVVTYEATDAYGNTGVCSFNIVLFDSTASEFITEWNIENDNTQITLPIDSNETYNYNINWGDGTIETNQTGEPTHIYSTAGTYDIEISGQFPRIILYLSDSYTKNSITKIKQWGAINWVSMENAFRICTNLDVVALDTPDLSLVENVSYMFSYSGISNADLNNWDVSNITNMSYMFEQTKNFRGAIDSWNVSNVTNMAYMFYVTELFNSSIASWNVSNVTDMSYMFSRASNFNNDLSNWNTGKVENMEYMFDSALLFNQDITNWNVSEVLNMRNMFYDARAFNQSLGGWNIGKVTSLYRTLNFTALSTENFDNTLIGWDSLPSLAITANYIGAEGLTYCSGAAAKANIESTYNTSLAGATLNCDFVTTWETTIVNETITIPTNDGLGEYNYSVDWGDGIIDTGLTGDASHTYATSGTHTVKIYGLFLGIYFNNQGDKDKILSVERWGANAWVGMDKAFYGCSKLVINDTESPKLIYVTSLESMFEDATSIAKGFANWNVGNIANMTNMFKNATSFNDYIGTWDISNVTNMSDMFEGVTLPTGVYDNLLIGWANGSVNNGVTFDAGNSYYCYGADAHQQLMNNTWQITDLGSGCSNTFNTVWRTTTINETIYIPVNTDGFSALDAYDYTIDWGDGTIEYNVNGAIIHEYQTPGDHVVKISGQFPRVYIYDSRDKDKLIEVQQWGDMQWLSMERAFNECSNINVTATDAPDLSMVTDMSYMFAYATNFNGVIGHWDVSNVINLNSVFNNAVSFNQPLDNWNVSMVENMNKMFANTLFNEPLNNWNVSSVKNMNYMFNSTLFDKPLNNWNVSSVTTMDEMFSGNIIFNQDISGWNTSSLRYTNSMFKGATAFNQNLNNWDTSQLEEADSMFKNTIAFNQSLGNWDLSSVSYLDDIFNNSGMSTDNYDATLIGWALDSSGVEGDGVDDITNGVSMGAITINYCAGETARQHLIDYYQWDITDGGKDPDCNFETTWLTTTANESITIYTSSSDPLYTYDYTIDWGDGTIEFNVTGDKVHQYTAAGTHTVKISGVFPHMSASQLGVDFTNANKLQSIESWGDIEWKSMEYAFAYCENMTITTSGAPNLSQVTNMSAMLAICQSLTNPDLSGWDVSPIEDMSYLFTSSQSFNSDISNWDVSNVTTMTQLFSDTAFNQPIGLWADKTANVKDMSSMFNDVEQFNQDLSNWDVSSVENMTGMFTGATTFNQDISNWNVEKVVDMTSTF